MLGLDNPIHIAFILIVLLMIFGAKRLPEMGKSLGQGLRGFKDSISGDLPADPAPAAGPQLHAAVPMPAPAQAQADPAAVSAPAAPAASADAASPLTPVA